jgi:hypothetical protein
MHLELFHFQLPDFLAHLFDTKQVTVYTYAFCIALGCLVTAKYTKQEAERKRVEAQGIADYQRIISMGFTDKQLQYESIKAQKELAASPNTKIIFMNGKGNTPVILSDK